MKEHAATIIDGGPGRFCLANGWEKAASSGENPETSMSELIARIERRREIIGELLATNEQLRNRLRRIEHSTRPAPHSELETAG